MSPLAVLIVNLLLTMLIEGALVLIFIREKKAAYHSVLLNMLTNPLLNLILIIWSATTLLPFVPYYYILTGILEVLVVFAEAILYNKMGDFGFKKAFFASLMLNAASFSFGLFIQ